MASIFFPQRWERDNLCDNRNSVPNSHVKPVRFILWERHFWKTSFLAAFLDLCVWCFESCNGHNFRFFYLFFSLRHQYCLLSLTKHHFRWNHGQKHHVRCRAKEKVNSCQQNARTWMKTSEEVLQEQKALRCLSSLRHIWVMPRTSKGEIQSKDFT